MRPLTRGHQLQLNLPSSLWPCNSSRSFWFTQLAANSIFAFVGGELSSPDFRFCVFRKRNCIHCRSASALRFGLVKILAETRSLTSFVNAIATARFTLTALWSTERQYLPAKQWPRFYPVQHTPLIACVLAVIIIDGFLGSQTSFSRVSRASASGAQLAKIWTAGRKPHGGCDQPVWALRGATWAGRLLTLRRAA